MDTHTAEHDNEKHNNAKQIGGGNVNSAIPKRAALIDLQNRVLPRAGKKDGEDNLKEAKTAPLRAIKGRADTRGRKDAQTEDATEDTTKPTRDPVAQRALGAVTRSVANRRGVAKTSAIVGTTANCIQRPKVDPTQTREITAVTTKMVESKLKEVKIIEREKPIPVQTKQEARTVEAGTLNSPAVDIKPEKEVNVKKIASKDEPIGLEIEEQDGNQVQTIDLKDKPSDSFSTAMINGVRNVDEGDEESLILVSEYVEDIYEYLFQLEIESPILKDHLADQKAVTPKMRAALLDWINELHSSFHLVVETFHMTVVIIDRYLQEVKDTKRKHLQLVGVTACFLAAKYEELYPPTMADFISMTGDSYDQQQMLEMEVKIFRSIGFNLSRPVSIHFLRRFSKAADVEDFEHALAKYFLELAAIEYELASYKPSEIAAASLFLSLHLSKGDPEIASGFNNSYWDRTMEHYSRYNAEHLRPISREIAKIARHAPKAALNAVYRKYQSSRFFKASLRPELYSTLMDSLIDA